MKKNNQRNKLKKEQQQLGKNNKKDWQKKHMKNKKNKINLNKDKNIMISRKMNVKNGYKEYKTKKIDQLENKLKILNLKYNKLVKNKHDPKF